MFNKMKDKEVLLVSDFVGVGKVALSMMIPVLSTMEANLNYLPTAVISNNFDYGEAAVQELNDFMEQSKDMWEKHKLRFDFISTGIVMNTKQVDVVKEIIDLHENRPIIISDPIMGDGGRIYPGLSKDVVKASREMALIADILIPNLTELSLIVGKEYPKEVSDEVIKKWLTKMQGRGVKAAIVTSVKIDSKHYVYGYSDVDNDIFRVEYDHIPVDVGGAGDIFTSLMIGHISKGTDIREGVKYTTEVLTNIIKKEYEKGITSSAEETINDIKEIRIQNYLQDIYNSL